MTLAERIPDMTDAELASLHVNALRLSAGDSARNREAADLLPALEAEVSARKVRKAGAKAVTARTTSGRTTSGKTTSSRATASKTTGKSRAAPS